MKYIELYPAKHKAFTELIKSNKLEFERILNEGKTKFDYNEEFTLRLEEVLDMMNGNNKVYLFVYGTLMRDNRQGQIYLDSEDFKGVGTLSGYALYDLEYFPGIVKDIDGRVKGELYSISEDMLSTIDTYEAEGVLYKRIMVKVYSEKDELVEAYVYVYNKPVLGKKKVEFSDQPWFSGMANANLNRNYVWYASYGSNTNKERFMKYIMGDESRDGIHRIGCSDKTPPKDEKQIIIQHLIYFSNNSPRWSNKGVAFLDLNTDGTSYGKMYLITKEQFKEIHKQEGLSWYNEIVDMGYEGGIPIKTFTHTPRLPKDVTPCVTYLEVIKKGIKETYPNLHDTEMDFYLLERYLVKDKLAVLEYIRKQEHGLSIQKITSDLSLDKEFVISIIKDLKDVELIKQDGRSVRASFEWDATEAVYYTISDRRAMIDQVLRVSKII